MLSEGIAAQRGRYGAYLHHDRVNKKLRARRGAASQPLPAAEQFPTPPSYSVVAEPDGANVGTPRRRTSRMRKQHGDIMLSATLPGDIRRIESKTAASSSRRSRARPRFLLAGEAPARTV